MLSDHDFEQLVAATREADELHQTSGGDTRHWVRECFLPYLEQRGLVITSSDRSLTQDQIDELARVTKAISPVIKTAIEQCGQAFKAVESILTPVDDAPTAVDHICGDPCSVCYRCPSCGARNGAHHQTCPHSPDFGGAHA